MYTPVSIANSQMTPTKINKNGAVAKVRILVKQMIRSKPAFTCSKLTIETLEQGVKYVQS